MSETPEWTGQHQALKFEHAGRAGEIAPIAVVVGLLNIVTLSFYRFWGKTRVRVAWPRAWPDARPGREPSLDPQRRESWALSGGRT